MGKLAMFTSILIAHQKRMAFALCALGLLVGTIVFCNRSGDEARAQGTAEVVTTQPTKGKALDARREEIARAVRSFAVAFEKGDAKALAAHWTENGEYATDDGAVFRGRAAIEKEYAQLFAKRKGVVKVGIDVDTIRFPSQDTAIEEGHFRVRAGKELAVTSKYSVLHVRENGKWLMAIVREWPGEGASLRDLDWLIGTWSAKRDDTEITTKYQWWGEKNFIRMDITIKDKKRTAKGFQMIGKDASTGQLRSWTFDPDGSFGEATWSREDKKWVLDATAVTGTGDVVTSTNLFVPVSDNAFTFQSVERTINDNPVPDIGPVRVTRVNAKN
jgi:uncharacterized protein (TIGR02246 family)